MPASVSLSRAFFVLAVSQAGSEHTLENRALTPKEKKVVEVNDSA
jgi:hypothetical protein